MQKERTIVEQMAAGLLMEHAPDLIGTAMFEILVAQMAEFHLHGQMTGLRAFSWMKDGVTYVGTCGTTLKEAQEMARQGKFL